MGRRIAVGLASVGLVGAYAARAGAATSSQGASGEATGEHGAILTPQTRYTDRGTYHSLSPLGNGRYDIETTGDQCVNGSIPLTGTATLRRGDGAQLTGTVSGAYGCPGSSSPSGASFPATFSLTLTSGRRDLIGARVQFTGQIRNVVAIPDGDRGDETLTIGRAVPVTASTSRRRPSSDGPRRTR